METKLIDRYSMDVDAFLDEKDQGTRIPPLVILMCVMFKIDPDFKIKMRAKNPNLYAPREYEKLKSVPDRLVDFHKTKANELGLNTIEDFFWKFVTWHEQKPIGGILNGISNEYECDTCGYACVECECDY